MKYGRLDRLFLAGLAALIALYLAVFVYYVAATVIDVPVYDFLGWILHFDRYWLAGDWWQYLWTPHNEHRLVWSRLLVVADIEMFRGTGLPFLLIDSACFALTVGGMVWATMRCADLALELRAILAAVTILLLAGPDAAIYCGVPVMGEHVHTTGLFVLALLLAGAEPCGPGCRLGAILAAALAPFGVAGGLVAPLVTIWVAWAGRWSRGWLVAVIAVSVALIAVYLPGLPVGHDAKPLGWAALLEMADYGIRFLGLPWSHAASLVWFGRLVGGLVLAGGVATLLCSDAFRRPVDGLERIGLALLMFGLAIAGLAAVSRSSVAPELTMPIRYGIFAGLAQVGLLLAHAPRLEWLWYERRLWRLKWAMLPIGAIFLAQQVLGGQAAVSVAGRYREAYRDFVAGRWDADADQYVFPNRANAEQALSFMRAQGIYGN